MPRHDSVLSACCMQRMLPSLRLALAAALDSVMSRDWGGKSVCMFGETPRWCSVALFPTAARPTSARSPQPLRLTCCSSSAYRACRVQRAVELSLPAWLTRPVYVEAVPRSARFAAPCRRSSRHASRVGEARCASSNSAGCLGCQHAAAAAEVHAWMERHLDPDSSPQRHCRSELRRRRRGRRTHCRS